MNPLWRASSGLERNFSFGNGTERAMGVSEGYSGACVSAEAKLVDLAAQIFPISPSFGSSEAWDHTSCRYLESGLSFYSDKVTACGVVHHGTGTPELAPYTGGPIPLEEIADRRAELIRKNQVGCESVCRNCPNLVRKVWPKRSGKIDWLGITHFNGCNNACDYCWLQWAENGRGKPNHPSKSYAIIPAIDQLVSRGLLAADAIVDYGGGGEPTLMPEFDELLGRFTRCGAEQWLHTNCVRMPEPVAQGKLDLGKVHVVCSVDSGTPGTYLLLKQRDYFLKVWANLEIYLDRGALVIAKYIMQGNNCSRRDIEGFIQHAYGGGISLLQWDIDLRFPDPSPQIIDGLAYLHHLARAKGLSLTPANIGLKSANREEVISRIESACRALEEQVADDATPPNYAASHSSEEIHGDSQGPSLQTLAITLG
jgi:radical SAM family protein